MHFFVRCLLWILMAALPLQGSAAVFAVCATQAPATASASAAHGCHERDAAAAHAMQPQDDGGAGQQPHGKCSTCASCCTAATAPPQSAPPPAPFPRAARASPAPGPAFTAIFPAGLERPPRAV